jgi:hypothetical protein
LIFLFFFIFARELVRQAAGRGDLFVTQTKGESKESFNGINIFDSPENLRMRTASVSSPSVSAGFSINRKRLSSPDAKPALTLRLPTPV